MEKGRGNGTDTLQTDKVFTRKEYIKREAAISVIAKISNESDMPVDWHKGMSVAMSAVCQIPAADVVPVVRCGECKFADNYGLDLMCQKHSGITKSKLGEDIHFVEWHSKNFFCSDGVRMKNDG